jgi:carbonic anhydrase/acetyltransferase-like protein (isoleucine patch superfamily)
MQASTVVGTLALVLAAALVAGYTYGDDASLAGEPKTAQKKIEEREAARRAAVAEQEKRKQEFQKRCAKPVKTAAELAECKSAYRQLELPY